MKPVHSTVDIIMVSGVEGPSIYLNNYRICGNKPWGGGAIRTTWTVDVETLRADLKNAMRGVKVPRKAKAKRGRAGR